jgi:phenylpropionate dioxygenase-like ring-hydroxylating dioxygenase large terminal subunit
MLTAVENEFVTRTGPGTPMGELLRRFWTPFALASEAPEADEAPVRIRLMSENLILFRDTDGRLGLLQENCPHRGTSLYFGVNDEGGLRCCYHGWKFDIEGRCVDMPSDAPGSTYKDRVRARAYPVLESAGALWTYMGPADRRPQEPGFVFNKLGDDHVVTFRFDTFCNFLQSMEGDIDTTHISTLHLNYKDETPVDDGTDRPGYPSRAFGQYIRASRKYARVDVQDTDYGLRLIAVRTTPKNNQFVRINCLVLPFSVFIASAGTGGTMFTSIPVDDGQCLRLGFTYRTDRPFTEEERNEILYSRNHFEADGKTRQMRADNDYLVDRVAQKTITPSGILPTREQDAAATESMGRVMDRTEEHLYHGDAAITRYRQLMINAARNLQEGQEPASLDGSVAFDKIRSEEIIIGPSDDPWLIACDAGEELTAGRRVAVAAGD